MKKNHTILLSTIFSLLIIPSLLAQTTCDIQMDDEPTICKGQSVQICVYGADNYHWSTEEQSACIIVSPEETTTYQVVASKNDCEATGQLTVNVDRFFMPSSDDQTICLGQSIEICASDAENYYWDNGKESACITVSPSQTKTFIVEGYKNGCKDTDYITVNVNESFNLQTDEDQTICAGQSIEICASDADSYWWSNGQENRCITVNPNETTIYQAHGVKNGCEDSEHITVIVEDVLNGDCGEDQFELTDANGELYLEHETQTYTKFFIGNDEKMVIQNSGKVGIGTETPMYKLDVCGTVRAVEVLVEDDWCDYVFDEDYTLPTLEEEKEHIETNGYLLGFESEEAMDGKISLHDVTKRQQVKIEEYALQLIQLNETNKILEQQNTDLAKKYNVLEAMLVQLQNKIQTESSP